MRILVINGPNMNLLGLREPALYGEGTYAALLTTIRNHCAGRNIEVAFIQSNHEGVLVDAIQDAFGRYDGLVINAAAYTHTSIALLDALRAVALPAVEVHLTDIHKREAFRQVSYVGQACLAQVAGKGFAGYLEAIDLLAESLQKSRLSG